MDAFVEVVQTLGFPIAMVFTLCYYINKLEDREESNRKETAATIDKLGDAVQEQNASIKTLVDKFDEIVKKLSGGVS